VYPGAVLYFSLRNQILSETLPSNIINTQKGYKLIGKNIVAARMASCRLIAPGPQEAVILPQHCWLPPLRKKPMHQELGSKLKRLWLRVVLLAPYFMLVVSLVQVGSKSDA